LIAAGEILLTAGVLKNVRKMRLFHNVYLTVFWGKNTISCGGFFLPTKHIVSPVLGGGPVILLLKPSCIAAFSS
jgi:hypothetical protein